MANPVSVTKYGSQMRVLMDDDTEFLAVPTAVSVWLITEQGSVTPPNPGTGKFSWPFAVGEPPEGGAVTSEYGARSGGTGTFHEGIDFGNPPALNGADIKCAAKGKVVFAGISGAFGNCVRVFHGTIGGKDIITTYNHMQDGSMAVSLNDEIDKGKVVGKIGNTGNSFGAHLHYEIHECAIGGGIIYNTSNNGNPRTAVNPRDFMAREGDGNVL